VIVPVMRVVSQEYSTETEEIVSTNVFVCCHQWLEVRFRRCDRPIILFSLLQVSKCGEWLPGRIPHLLLCIHLCTLLDLLCYSKNP
jgi:hypothetical protein